MGGQNYNVWLILGLFSYFLGAGAGPADIFSSHDRDGIFFTTESPEDVCDKYIGPPVGHVSNGTSQETEEVSAWDQLSPPGSCGVAACDEYISNLTIINAFTKSCFQARLTEQELACSKKISDLNAELERITFEYEQKIIVIETNCRNNIERLNKEIEELRAYYERLLLEKQAEVDDCRNGHKKSLVYMLILNVKLAEYGTAMVHYMQLNDIAYIDEILSEAYAGKEYFENLVIFITSLSLKEHRVRGFIKLYDLLHDNSHLGQDFIIIFRKALNDELKRSCSAQQAPLCDALHKEMAPIKANVDSNANSLLSIWATSIRSGSGSHIIDFGSPPVKNMAGVAFEEILPELISKAFASSTNHLWTCLTFSVSLRWNMHKYIGISQLNSYVSSPGHKIMVALKAKEAMANLNGPDPSTSSHFQNLKNSLASNVRGLVWHQSCYLKNTAYPEYLYGSVEYKFDDNNFRVLTWKPGGTVSQSPWRFEYSMVNGEILFKIKNAYYNWYLCSYKMSDKKERRWVSLKNSCGDQWRVIPLAWPNSDVVNLYNMYEHEYLYASQYDFMKDRRYPYLWTPGNPVHEGNWNLECYE